jgi:hypothetical protein
MLDQKILLSDFSKINVSFILLVKDKFWRMKGFNIENIARQLQTGKIFMVSKLLMLSFSHTVLPMNPARVLQCPPFVAGF